MTEAVSGFPNGLVLIEREIKKKVPDCSSDVVSEDVLFLARREAQRLRTMRQNNGTMYGGDNEHFGSPTVARRVQSAKPSTLQTGNL